MDSYIVEIQEDVLTGELLLELPDEIVETLGWLPGDILSWTVKQNGIYLSKVGEQEEYQKDEDL